MLKLVASAGTWLVLASGLIMVLMLGLGIEESRSVEDVLPASFNN